MFLIPETVVHFDMLGKFADANGTPDSLYCEQCGLRALLHLLGNPKNAIELNFHLAVDASVWRRIS